MRIEEREKGIELNVSRKDLTQSVTGSQEIGSENITLANLTEDQVLAIIKIINKWLNSKSFPLMNTTIDDVEGCHTIEQKLSSTQGVKEMKEDFERVTITISEREFKIGYWLESEQEWRDIALPSSEVFEKEVPQDIENLKRLYGLCYDFFTAEYSGSVDFFEHEDSVKTEKSAIFLIEEIFNRFGEIVIPLQEREGGKEPLTMDKEADVQYLLHALLKLHFEDVRRETHTERHSSVSPRIDFLVQNETIGIEVKRASPTRRENKLRKELSTDKEQYRVDSNVETLLVFVYDPEKQIENKSEFEASFDQDSPQMNTRVTVTR